MRECLLASSVINSESAQACPKAILTTAVDAMNQQHKETNYSLLGSSTAITAVVDKDNDRYYSPTFSSIKVFSAKICNLGDSGFVLIRGGKIIARSKEQTHYFNCPYQLALPTPGYRSMADKPQQGDMYDIESFENMGKIWFLSSG